MHPYNLGDLTPDIAEADCEALIDHRPGGRRWTYRQIDQAASEVGRRLLGAGCSRGDSVAILAANSAEFLLCYFGAMRAGLVAVPLNYKLSKNILDLLLDDCEAKIVVTDAERRSLVSASRAVLDIDQLTFVDGPSVADPAVKPAADEIAEILYTSGSTGRPKGVPLSHAGQLWALTAHLAVNPAGEQTTIVVAPMYHMNAMFNISMSLMNRVRIVLMPRFEVKAWLHAISDFGCTLLSGIPSMYAMAAREKYYIATLNFDSVRAITLGSAPVTKSLLSEVEEMFPKAVISNGYGTTETGPAIFGDHPDGLKTPALSLGYPLRAIAWRLVGGSQNEGVFEMKTPAQLKGYRNLPQATAERITDGWYMSGDIMRRDENGFFYFVGRVDDMFNCGGENVYPGEIEKLVERHPDVMQSAVVAIPDKLKGQIPICFVTGAYGKRPDPAELKSFTLMQGPAYAHPRAFVVLSEMPVAGTHKIDKRKLIELALEVGKALGRD